jgi:HPt (histidine-containing phosphotransfer) domain-containing protein
MKYDLAWLESLGLDTQTGISYTGRFDKYLSAVYRFFINYEKNKSKLEKYYAVQDKENFLITVHALKSNAKMIGAMGLSSQFEKMEAASNKDNVDYIKENLPILMEEYKELVKALAPMEKDGVVKAVDEISAEEAQKVGSDLLEALDDFDDELSKELIQKLAGYPFRVTQRERLKAAMEYIDDFLYDEAAAVIKAILPTIE